MKRKQSFDDFAIVTQHLILSPLFVLLLLFIPCFSSSLIADEDEPFSVHHHLSIVTRYEVVKDIVDNTFVPTNIPDTCRPIHLNLLARHGTRSPTDKRLQDLERLETSLQTLIADAEEHLLSLEKVPTWLFNWTSPWKKEKGGGQLIVKGEHELYDLGIRIREKYLNLFNDEYHPDVYTINATQVHRASASAVAFAMGLLSENGSLGPGKHRAFAVSIENRTSDKVLRFFENCKRYKNYKAEAEPEVEKLKEPIINEITKALIDRYGLNFTRNDTSFLWFLCQQEASLLDITNQACDLFNPTEISLLEWTDDLGLFILKGYGNSLNYLMGLALLEDVINSMELAIKANEDVRTEALSSGSYEKARLRFAHAETLIPFSCLLGLFLEGSDFNESLQEKPLKHLPMPPDRRSWRGSVVAPFAGNNMLVLYSCPDGESSEYFVHVLHNEHPVPLPGCGADFCAFEKFKKNILEPRKKYKYDAICKLESDPSAFPNLQGKLSDVKSHGTLDRKGSVNTSPHDEL